MKVLLDTNVLIRFSRNPELRQAFEVRTRRPLLFMSSVVAMELLAGCSSARDRGDVHGFLAPFEEAGRMVVPDHSAFLEAGRVLAALKAKGIGAEHRRRLITDVLIAVSAGRAGIKVVTENHSDFRRISEVFPVSWISPDLK